MKKHNRLYRLPPAEKASATFATDATEFARRHKISVAVARAILLNAHNTEDADRAVMKMRG